MMLRWWIGAGVVGLCVGSPRAVLHELYDLTGGDEWLNNTNWKTDDVCSYFGVECAGEVVAIRLAENNLIGTIPASLLGIESLKTLDVSDNSVQVQWAAAPGLRELDLTRTDVSFTGIAQVVGLESLKFQPPAALNLPFPEELCELRSLRRLHLVHRALQGTVPACIQNLEQLQELYLFHNHLTGSIPTELTNLPKLQNVSLAYTEFNGTLPVFASFDLEILNMRGGKNSRLGGSLPSFTGNPRLHHLFLDAHQFSGSIPYNFLQNNINLYELMTVHLEYNQLTGSVPESLVRFERLNIELVGNKFVGPLPHEFCRKSLWMNGNVGEYGCDAILCRAGTYSLSGQGLCEVCDGATDTTQLGAYQCDTDIHVAQHVSNQEALREEQFKILHEFYQNLHGPRRWKHPWTDLDKVPYIDNENLHYAHFYDVCTFHGVMCNADKFVEVLTLPRNRMIGEIPKSIFRLPYLQSLDLSYNPVTLESFSDLRYARHLTSLKLSHTLLDDMIGIGQGIHLTELYLDGCDFGNTPLPDEILKLNELQVLHLEASFLTGPIPQFAFNTDSLQSLYLNENALTGTIPRSLAEVKLTHLDLSDNNLRGTLPPELSDVSTLVSLRINNAGLTGKLPNFADAISLVELELANNAIDGKIPVDFLARRDPYAKMTVRLSENRLEGVPPTLSRFPYLTIELDDNRIPHIPEELCQNTGWMNGEVGMVESGRPCDAILCPRGFWSPNGRASKELGTTCKPCSSNDYFGETVCEVTGLSTNREVEILNKLFDETGGRYWNISHTNWTNPGVPICYREGIICGWKPADMNSGVTEIRLDHFGLRGEIPNDVFRIPKLRRLSFSDNPVDISFDGIGHAEILEILSFSRTDVVSLRGIESAGDLLREIDAKGNGIHGPFPSEILEIRGLRGLHLDDNRITGTLPTSIQALVNLERLTFSKNDIRGTIPIEFGALANLKRVDMSENRFSGVLPTELGRLGKMERFHVGDQKGDHKLSGDLYPFSNHPNMVYLNVSWNQFSGTVPDDMFLASTATDKGKILDLSENKLNGPFPESWADRFNMLYVDLSANVIDELPIKACDKVTWMNGIGAIVEPNQRCDTLLCAPGSVSPSGRQKHRGEPCRKCADKDQAPYFGSKACQDPTAAQERKLLHEFANLAEIDGWFESRNWQSDRHVCSWHGVTCSPLGYVTRVNLADNGLDCAKHHHAHKAIGLLTSLPSLKTLVLDNNRMGLRDLISVSPDSKIEVFSASGIGLNSLEGVENMKRLRRLEVAANHIQGALPEALFKMTTLEELDFASNKLDGTIPTKLGRLTNLRVLSMPSNSFHGVIPKQIAALKNIEYINLRRQQGESTISGKLPAFSTLTKLRYLDLSKNNLTGKIPKDFLAKSEQRAEEVKIFLDGNSLEGEVPSSLDQFAKLTVGLSDNKIVSIPDNLCKMEQWFGGNVGAIGSCDAILCPEGTFSRIGRQESDDRECLQCASASSSKFLGRTRCNDISERKTLESLFQATHGKKWNEKGGWNQKTPVCSWFGVECSGSKVDDDGIVALRLPSNGMSGELPPEIFLLPTLTDLDVSGNPSLSISLELLAGQVPLIERMDLRHTVVRSLDGIGNAMSLRELAVSGLPGRFPTQITLLAGTLEKLDLSGSFLVGTIPSRIGELTKLSHLDLYANDLHGTVPESINQLASIEHIDISENLMSGPLPDGPLASLSRLKYFSLKRDAKVGRKVDGDVPSFPRSPKLEHLVLRGNELSGEIPDDFLEVSYNTKEVDLSRNRLTGVSSTVSKRTDIDLKVSANVFNENSKKKSDRDILLAFFKATGGVTWRNNDFWSSKAHVCDWFGVACSDGHVIMVNLPSNGLSGTVPSEIYSLERLQVLRLNENPDLTTAFNNIANAKTLQDLSISGTKIGSLKGLEQAKSLSALDMSHCSLKGKFPSEVSSLENLRHLSLSNNTMTGDLPTISQLRYLRELNLSHNRHSGNLPTFQHMVTLSSLDLSFNRFEGAIPPDFLYRTPSSQPVGSLRVNLRGNRLKGSLSEELRRFEGLKLDISDNQINEIPIILCKQGEWNNGTIQEYGCDAIACPPGTMNPIGRKSDEFQECTKCSSAKKFGQTHCGSRSSVGRIGIFLGVGLAAISLLF